MALQLHDRHRYVQFLFGENILLLSNETIKSYLPNLWRLRKHYLTTRNHIHLEDLISGKDENARVALTIILNALKGSETQYGVASELKLQLDDARDNHAADSRDPEWATCTTFCNVARLLRPQSALGRHPLMAYAMAEWFTILAAESVLRADTLFSYLLALDRLGADMTDPLHAFLRNIDVYPCELRKWTLKRVFRPKTLKKMNSLLMDRWQKEGSVVAAAKKKKNCIVAGGDLHLEEIIERYYRDPDSVTVDLGHRRYDHPEGEYLALTTDDDLVCDCERKHHSCLEHSYLEPQPCPFEPCWQHHQPQILPPLPPSSRYLGPPIAPTFDTRPPLQRFHTSPVKMLMH